LYYCVCFQLLWFVIIFFFITILSHNNDQFQQLTVIYLICFDYCIFSNKPSNIWYLYGLKNYSQHILSHKCFSPSEKKTSYVMIFYDIYEPLPMFLIAPFRGSPQPYFYILCVSTSWGSINCKCGTAGSSTSKLDN